MAISDRIAQARMDYFTREAPTRIDIRPTPENGGDQAFFGKDGLTFRDVIDAINPLNHIPIVSDVFASATDHKASTASKLIGGTLLGGPIGFVASLATIIFENATGESPTQAAYAALTGTTAQPTQLADVTPPEPVELAGLSPAASPAAMSAPTMNQSTTAPISTKDKAVLDLYGTSTSAHASYRNAQMLPYLRDVTTSKML